MRRWDEPKGEEYRSLEDRSYDLLGELILEMEIEELLQEIEKDKAEGNTAEMDAFFEKVDKKNLLRIRRYVRKAKYRRIFTQTLPKISRIAAVAITIIALTGCVALATSQTVRIEVMRLILNIEEQYTELKLRADPEASFDIPADWEGENYPAYIPKGLVLDRVHSLNEVFGLDYIDPATGETIVTFFECSASSETNVDTEGAVIKPITIRGNPGFIATKGDLVSVYWDNSRRYFILTVKGEEMATVLRIAESVIRVN